MRRVRQGVIWHPATDNLRGTDVYGTAGARTADITFSLPFASLITSDETLFLLADGMRALHVVRIKYLQGFHSACDWVFSLLLISCLYS